MRWTAPVNIATAVPRITVDFAPNSNTFQLLETVGSTYVEDARLRKALPGCQFDRSLEQCGCPLPLESNGAVLPSMIIAGATKAGTTTLVDLLTMSKPAARLPESAANNGEAFFWVPEFLTVVDDSISWRGWRCGDATSFARSIGRLAKDECTASGYRSMVWANHTHSDLLVEKTPDYIVWPHVHVALRALVGSGTKILVMLRHPLLRLMSHYRHFMPWVLAFNSKRRYRHGDGLAGSGLWNDVLQPGYVQEKFGKTFEEYVMKMLHGYDFQTMMNTINVCLATSDFLCAVDAYASFIYEQCDATDWHGTCALKRGVLQSMYLPQMLSLLRYIGGCPGRWLRVIQTEQLFEEPKRVLSGFWSWLGIDGPLSLNMTTNRRPSVSSKRTSPHRRRHLMTHGHFSYQPEALNLTSSLIRQWDHLLAELLAEMDASIVPFDISLWNRIDAAIAL